MIATLALAAGAVFFDDFSHFDVNSLQTRGGWTLRTAAGHPGVPGARWAGSAISLMDDPAQPGNRLLRLRAQTDGTPAGTEQAQLCHQRKVLRGTYAARVRFTHEPVQGQPGDPVIQTFYLVSPLRHDFDPEFSEVDFEYLPHGGWGSPVPRLYAISWQTVRLEPWQAHNRSHELAGRLSGWQDLLIQVDATHTRHYLNGQLIHTTSGRTVPVVPMSINFNLWFSPGGLLPQSTEARAYVQEVDWVFHAQDAQLTPAQVQAKVSSLRSEGVAWVDQVPAVPGVTGSCDF